MLKIDLNKIAKAGLKAHKMINEEVKAKIKIIAVVNDEPRSI